MLWIFEADSWEEAKRVANDLISALRAKEMDSTADGEGKSVKWSDEADE